MKILSDPEEDVRHRPQRSGGYEWWYFDGLSTDEKYSFVIIFYEGNPFSTRYNKAQLNGKNPMPSNYPAISISIYEDDSPIYYSFTEFEKADCSFSEDRPLVKIGPHTMERFVEDGHLKYQLHLHETLASNDKLDARLTLTSNKNSASFSSGENESSEGHVWNLVQPRAVVKAKISISVPDKDPREIIFSGHGYHDHNTGQEPMRNKFTDWYWGRIHFEYATLVYYVMNRQDEKQHRAWLIGNNNAEVLDTFTEITLAEDRGLTLFGLNVSRKLSFYSAHAEIQVQLSSLLDNGPFYQRYRSDGFLQVPDSGIIESQSGIGEYIYPDRIYSRLFWPFLDMRIRYKSEKPHWVQKSTKLYRWTW